MWVFFSFCWVPPSHKATADKCSEGLSEGFVLGFFVLFWVGVCSEGPYSEVRALSQSSRIKSIVISYFLEGASRPRVIRICPNDV
jgi:hypothetical protein